MKKYILTTLISLFFVLEVMAQSLTPDVGGTPLPPDFDPDHWEVTFSSRTIASTCGKPNGSIILENVFATMGGLGPVYIDVMLDGVVLKDVIQAKSITGSIYPKYGGGTITGLKPGTYEIQMVDVTFSVDLADPDAKRLVGEKRIITIIEPDAVTFTNSVVDATCNGGADGRINITGQGGSKTGYQTAIDGGAYEDKLNLTSLVAGEYTIKVKDSDGCESAEKTITITEPSAVTFTNSVGSPKCKGSSDGRINITSPAGGSGTGYTTAIDGGAYEDKLSLTNLVAGIYAVKIKDSNGCESTEKIITIIEPDAVTFTSGKVDAKCNGSTDGRINITGQGGSGTGYTPVVNGVPNGSLTNLGVGTYKVKVKDSKGCESTEKSITIGTLPNSLTFTNSVVSPKCNGGTDGRINITSRQGGSGTGYTIIVNEFNNGSLTNLTAGEYKIKVSDSKGCVSAVKTITITEPDIEEITFTIGKVDAKCKGSSDGRINITNQAGGNGTGYTTVVNGVPNGSLTNLRAGTYRVKVKDSEGNESAEKTITITEPSAVTFTNSVGSPKCKGSSDGRINITSPAGGSGTGYTTAIDGGAYEDKLSLTNLVAGIYAVKIKDSNGCESTEKIITIIEPDAVTFTNSVVDATCNGGADGRINITGQGGSKTGYQTSIDGGAYEDKLSLTTLVAGEYTVKIKDSDGCESAEK